MDGVGRLARSLILRAAGAAADGLRRVHTAALIRYRRRLAEVQATSAEPYARPSAFDFWRRRIAIRIANARVPRGVGLAATAFLMIGTVLFGIQRGGHWPAVGAGLLAVGDDMANAVGLQVRAVRLSGHGRLSHAEVLEIAGITERSSVLLFDPEGARARLIANPWIAEATLQKLYPDQLLVSIVEREPFALWQRDGRIAVIARDGTVILDRLDGRFVDLPLVAGPGAGRRAAEIVDALRAQPTVGRHIRAAMLVGERRWTLITQNGIDVKLPERGLDGTLAQLARLDTERSLMTRDVMQIDLRVPGRVSVRLSEEAHKAHETALRERQRQRRLGQPT